MATLYYNNATGDGNWATVPTAATGFFYFPDYTLPYENDTVTVGGVVFEFDSDESTAEGNVAVPIGADAAATVASLASAIEANVPVTASIGAGPNGWIALNLVANSPGTTGNIPNVALSGFVMSMSGMSGGTDTNWWTDEACTIPATSLPTSSDSVVVAGSLSQNTSGSEPTVVDFAVNSGGGSSIAITVTGTATFSGASHSGTITGNVTFSDTSYNYGQINGNATFLSGSHNLTFASPPPTITGDATFDASINSGHILGNATFQNGGYNGSPWSGNGPCVVTGDATFEAGSSTGPSYNSGSVGGNATFYGNSYNGGTVSGTATFNSYSPTYGSGNSYNIGTVGTGVFNNGSTNGYYSPWPTANQSGYVSGNATFTDAYNVHGTVWGDATFEGYARNGWYMSFYPFPWAAGEFARVSGTATFNDYSVNGQWAAINVTATFNDFSRNEGSGTIVNPNNGQPQTALGALVFNDNSKNDSREMYYNYSASVTFNDESENRGGFLSTPYPNSYLPEPTLTFNREYTTVVNGINGSSILGVL